MLRKVAAFTLLFAWIACVTPASADNTVTITEDVVTGFGVYRPITVLVTPSVPPYEIASDLSNVARADDYDLTDEARKMLAANGFVAVAGQYRQAYDVYNQSKDTGAPSFVTTDACLHTYHILYDYILRVVEIEYFHRDLLDMTLTLIETMKQEYEEATDPSVKQAALDNIAYLSVALKLLEPTADIDSRVADVVERETGMIAGLSPGYVPSPLLFTDDYPYEEDYSQYKPRGHYTRNETLERYFRTMMWYGRVTFSLNLPGATADGIRHAAVQALLLSKALDSARMYDDSERPVSEMWRRIYEPTVFFVGEVDDITYDAYVAVAMDHFGRSFTRLRPDALADTAKIDAFIADALELPGPIITVKAGKGLRLMGQRFIPDSYVLDQLVEEFVSNRLMPRGLDVMAALGSSRAYDIISTVYGDPSKYPDYDPQLAKMRAEIAGYTPSVWAENLYYNWLYSLLPLLGEKGEGYPMFMQNEAWTDKSLSTALGSWAELRHDTILYAKQSETRETSMPQEPELVRGYVEPEPEVYARLASLAAYTRDGLAKKNLLDALFTERLMNFERLMLDLTAIACAELENRTLSDHDYALICNFGSTIEEMTTFPSEFGERYESDADDFMAVIADIHTDPNTNRALEVGVGHPLVLYVIAPVEGVPTLTRGAMFAYHEFTRSLAEGRLTDEEWQALQSGPNAVDMPEWTGSFRSGPSSAGTETYHIRSNGRYVTSVEDEEILPRDYAVIEAYPNPFNPSTMLDFRIDTPGVVRIAVYSLTGQLVDVLADRMFDAGSHTLSWSPDGLASGVYIVRMDAGAIRRSVRVTFLK